MVDLDLILVVVKVPRVDVLMAIEHVLPKPIVLTTNLPSYVVRILFLDFINILVFIKFREAFVLHYGFKNCFHDIPNAFYGPKLVVEGF